MSIENVRAKLERAYDDRLEPHDRVTGALFTAEEMREVVDELGRLQVVNRESEQRAAFESKLAKALLDELAVKVEAAVDEVLAASKIVLG